MALFAGDWALTNSSMPWLRTGSSRRNNLSDVLPAQVYTANGHVFVVMLALLLQRELERCWIDMDITVEEGIDELASIHMQEIKIGGATIQNIPKPTTLGKQLLNEAAVTLPTVLPKTTANVHTKKNLPSERIKK